MAKKKVKFSSKFLLLPLILTVLALVGAFMLPKNQSVEPIEEESVVNNETKVEETIENGVYINHTYGFRFEFSNDVFTKYDRKGSAERSSFWNTDKNSGIKITIQFPYDDNFKKINLNGMTSCVNNASPVSYIKTSKIYEIKNVCAEKVEFVFGAADGLEPSWGYAGYFKTTNGVIAISMNTGFAELESMRHEFEKIVNSFEFTAAGASSAY